MVTTSAAFGCCVKLCSKQILCMFPFGFQKETLDVDFVAKLIKLVCSNWLNYLFIQLIPRAYISISNNYNMITLIITRYVSGCPSQGVFNIQSCRW